MDMSYIIKRKKQNPKNIIKKQFQLSILKIRLNLETKNFLNCPKISFNEREEDKEKDDKTNFFEEEESNSLQIQQKEDEESKTEIIVTKNINSPDIYTGPIEKSIDNSEDNKNDSDKIKGLNNELTNSNNLGYKLIPIKQEEYEKLLKGNFEFLQKFNKKISKKYMADGTAEKIKLLGKKKKRTRELNNK